MVRMERLELSRREALEPKSSVSTNSTTSACRVDACIIRISIDYASVFWRSIYIYFLEWITEFYKMKQDL